MTTFQQGIIALTRTAVTGRVSELPDDFSLDNLDLFAKKHQISSIMLYGIVTLGLSSTHPAVKKLYVRSCSEILLSEKQLAEIESVRSLFNGNGISFILLKGSVIKSMYPKPEMRIMGDIDLLIKSDQYNEIKRVLSENGYAELYESDHEFAWKSPNGILIELHKSLIPTYYDELYSYFGDGWKFAIRTDNGSEYRFSPEDHFLYIFTHFAKHYSSGGIGIKHLCDLWLYKRNYPELDCKYIEQELKKLELFEFYTNVSKTEKVWFEDAASGEITEKISETIINSGAYGTHEARVNAEALRISRSNGKKDVSKFRLFMRKIFPSASVMSVKYKFLRKFVFLLPIAWAMRWFDAVFRKRDSIKRHANDIKLTSEEKILHLEKDLALVGLKYNTKEKS